MAVVAFIGRLARREVLAEPALAPAGFKGAVLPAADAIPPPANPIRDHEASHAVGQRAFIIDYTDAAGHRSERRIVAHAVEEEDGHVFVKARCLERQAIRTFRVDRISAIYSGVTGEDLGPPATVLLPTRSRRTLPSAAKPATAPPVTYALRVLMTIARADGQVHPAELDVVRVFLDEALPDAAYGEATDLVDHAASLAPSFETFLDAVDKVCERDMRMARLMAKAATDLAEADGQVDADEADLVDDIAMILRAYEGRR